MKNLFELCLAILLSVLLLPTMAAAQSGGQFAITQAVVANGGGNSSGGNFGATTTSGQSFAGIESSTTPFGFRSGFWQSNLVPTAATVSVTGRVTTEHGNGIRGVRLTLTSPDGARRTAITSTFGYYAFDGVEVGHTYVLEIAAKRYTFANPTRIFSLQDHVTDMDFTAEPL